MSDDNKKGESALEGWIPGAESAPLFFGSADDASSYGSIKYVSEPLSLELLASCAAAHVKAMREYDPRDYPEIVSPQAWRDGVADGTIIEDSPGSMTGRRAWGNRRP